MELMTYYLQLKIHKQFNQWKRNAVSQIDNIYRSN